MQPRSGFLRKFIIGGPFSIGRLEGERRGCRWYLACSGFFQVLRIWGTGLEFFHQKRGYTFGFSWEIKQEGP